MRPWNKLHCSQNPLLPSVSALLAQNGKVLLVRRRHAPYRGEWSLPGGKIRSGEGMLCALKRELYEETHLNAYNSALYQITVVHRKYRLYCFRVFDWSGTLFASDDATHVRWIPIAALSRFTRRQTYQTIHHGLRYIRRHQ